MPSPTRLEWKCFCCSANRRGPLLIFPFHPSNQTETKVLFLPGACFCVLSRGPPSRPEEVILVELVELKGPTPPSAVAMPDVMSLAEVFVVCRCK